MYIYIHVFIYVYIHVYIDVYISMCIHIYTREGDIYIHIYG